MRYVILGVILQGSTHALLAESLTASDSLRFSMVAFGLAALGAVLLRRATPAGSTAAPMTATEVIALNVATAVTFLSFYLAVAWVPASVAAGIETGIAPAVALALLGRRSTSRQWLFVGALLTASVALGTSHQEDTGSANATFVLGAGLAAVAGIGMTSIAALSHRLSSRGIRPLDVLAVRYHLTYVTAAAAAVVIDTGAPHQLCWPSIVIFAAIGVVAPLALYQIGMSSTPPLVVMSLITLTPVISLLTEALLGAPVTATQGTLVALITVLAIFTSRPQPRSRFHAPQGP